MKNDNLINTEKLSNSSIINHEVLNNVWEGIGEKVKGSKLSKKLTSSDAFKQTKLDFIVDKKGMYIVNDTKKISVPNKYATVRRDTNAVLGVVGEKYNIIQNTEAFNFFDSVINQNLAKYETVGKFGNGESVFITAKLNSSITVGEGNDAENISLHIILTNSHDAAGAISILVNPVRDLNNASLNARLAGRYGNNSKTYRHTSGILDNITEGEIMDIVGHYKENLSITLNKMANTIVGEDVYERIIVEAMADNDGMVVDYFTPEGSKRFKGIIERIMVYALNHPTQQTKYTKGTLFGVYNAIAGYFQNLHEWKTGEEDKMLQILDSGSRLSKRVQKTFDECVNYLNNSTVKPIKKSTGEKKVKNVA